MASVVILSAAAAKKDILRVFLAMVSETAAMAASVQAHPFFLPLS
jgi:hypothetical protein